MWWHEEEDVLGSPLLRSLDELSESLFNPGGSGGTVTTDSRHPTVTFGTVPATDKDAFEENRKKDIRRLNEEYQRVNEDLTRLVRARNSAQDDNDNAARELREENERLEEATKRLQDNLKKQENEFRATCKSIRDQNESLLKERDDQIQENEQTRMEILEKNETISERQRQMIYEVPELEAKRNTLTDNVGQHGKTTVAPDVSRIPKDPYEGMPNLESEGTPSRSSTPSGQDRTNQFLGGYNPYANDRASRHVNSDVYQRDRYATSGKEEEETRRNTLLNSGAPTRHDPAYH